MRNSRKRTRSLQRRTIEDEIALLRDLDLKGLRTHWQNEFDRAAPEHLTRYLLFRILAYSIQADRLGDLDAETPQGSGSGGQAGGSAFGRLERRARSETLLSSSDGGVVSRWTRLMSSTRSRLAADWLTPGEAKR